MTDDKKRDNDRSYFAVDRRRKKKRMTILAPIIIGVISLISILAYTGSFSLDNNKVVHHKHANLQVAIDGTPFTVPQDIGIAKVGADTESSLLLYGNHTLDRYGVGMSPLHTHDPTGTIHVESNVVRDYTLADFLNIWKGLDIDGKVVEASVNGKPVTDYKNIILNDNTNIKLNIMS